ncbi:MAG: SDR family oxidoreductase [Paracoccaceae bacterium]
MTIAVTGSTGQLGRLAIAALKSRVAASDIIALARDTAKAGDLSVTVRPFDYQKPETLVPALKGVDTLVLISSNDFMDRAKDHAAVIDAAKAAGVGRIVYTSILKGAASPLLLATDHIKTEAVLKASGIPHTNLRNGWYTENYTGSLGGALQAGAMIGSAGDAKISAAPRKDYAEAIAVVATTTGHDGKSYELAGDKPFTMTEMAAEVSRQTGKTIPYNSLPEATYTGILQSFGLPEAFAAKLADSDVQSAKGHLRDDSQTLSKLIGRPTTPMADTVKAALAAL